MGAFFYAFYFLKYLGFLGFGSFIPRPNQKVARFSPKGNKNILLNQSPTKTRG